MSKWNTDPEIGKAMDARINDTPGYAESLIPGSTEHHLFQLPIADLARAALYEARNCNQGEEYTQRWNQLILMRAKKDPVGTAEEIVRAAYDSHSAKEFYWKNPNQKTADTPLSLQAAQTWGVIVSGLAESSLPQGAQKALALANRAEEWLAWGCAPGNNCPELCTQIKAVRVIAEPIVETEQLMRQQAVKEPRLAAHLGDFRYRMSDGDFLADSASPDPKATPEAQAKQLLHDGYRSAGLSAKDYEPTEENMAAARARAVPGQDTNCGTQTLHTYKHCLEKTLDFYREAYGEAPEGSATFVEARNAFRMTISERAFSNTLPNADPAPQAGGKLLQMELQTKPITNRPARSLGIAI